jgi:Zn finger protein HypA/HybF involved in hydrogenase expression
VTGASIDAACTACGAALTSELDRDIDDLSAEQAIRITTSCPICGGQAVAVASGRSMRNARGYLVRTGGFELPA